MYEPLVLLVRCDRAGPALDEPATAVPIASVGSNPNQNRDCIFVSQRLRRMPSACSTHPSSAPCLCAEQAISCCPRNFEARVPQPFACHSRSQHKVRR
ncbi:hypothetical protein FVE85_6357 [Porphyridium purpureum]|uniref:Uncharacterized protein n=1 Tax=Porphyridium purpureum TaxID=35688 RepID=A0A5J4Z6T8_PORPP|nr:hypothetical protein FVE85_6357 [Porphyridium purpureum]|eukprot:POR5519..scf295_1